MNVRMHMSRYIDIRCRYISPAPSLDVVFDWVSFCGFTFDLHLSIEPFICHANAVIMLVQWLFNGIVYSVLLRIFNLLIRYHLVIPILSMSAGFE